MPLLKKKLEAELSFWEINVVWDKTLDEAIPKYCRELLNLIPDKEYSRCLELGPGAIPSLTDPRFKEVFYIDPLYKDQHRLLKERTGHDADYYTAEGQIVHWYDAELGVDKLTLPPMDLIVFRNGLDHVYNINVLQTLYNLLKDDGLFVLPFCHVFDYADEESEDGVLYFGRKKPGGGFDSCHPYTWSERGLRGILEQHFNITYWKRESVDTAWNSFVRVVCVKDGKSL